MNLREITRPLHHSAEQHPIGAAMANGTISKQDWADWLGALLIVHRKIDPLLPAACGRVSQILSDLEACKPFEPRENLPAISYANSLTSYQGAFYVFTGAHLMGGAVIRKRLVNRLPCEHLAWADRKEAIQSWQHLREATEHAKASKDAFSAILRIMDAIYAHST
jgi:heme oxygenase